MRLHLLNFSALAAAAALDHSSSSGGRCSDVTFSVSVTAINNVFNNSPDPSNATQIDNAVSAFLQGGGKFAPIANKTVSSTFDIAAVYCEPPASAAVASSKQKHESKKTLQLLVHGASYNSTYWTGLGFDRYSYVKAALARGHSTLAIDRLGHGRSSHPDPISTLQFALEVETLHQLISDLKGPNTSTATSKHHSHHPLPHAFDRIIYVGHSYGSFLANGLSAKYPDDAAALLLTGYSAHVELPTPLRLVSLRSVSDAGVSGPDIANRDLAPAYLRGTNATGRTAAFYGAAGDFDPAVARFDAEHADTIGVGELFSPGGFATASRFGGPVLVAAGAEDALFCAEQAGPCAAQLEDTKALFPAAASRFETYVAGRSGHCLNLDFAAQTTFARMLDWVDGLEYH